MIDLENDIESVIIILFYFIYHSFNNYSKYLLIILRKYFNLKYNKL